jgi:hypothetical protein
MERRNETWPTPHEKASAAVSKSLVEDVGEGVSHDTHGSNR